MSRRSRWEYIRAVHARYRQADRRLKHTMVNEFCANMEYNRKYAIRLFNGLPRNGPSLARAVSVRRATVRLWFRCWRRCGRPPATPGRGARRRFSLFGSALPSHRTHVAFPFKANRNRLRLFKVLNEAIEDALQGTKSRRFGFLSTLPEMFRAPFNQAEMPSISSMELLCTGRVGSA